MTTTTAMHWAADLIGLPWEVGAQGPDAYNCFGLVREAVRRALGVEMPLVDVEDGSADNVQAIKRAADAGGWRLVGGLAPAEHDIVLMHGPDGRHVGFMVRADGRLLLLHSMEGAGVVAQPLHDVAAAGFQGFEVWRRVP